MNSFLTVPPELQATPALIAGFLALLGLILWTAGVRVAKPLAVAFAGAGLAIIAATFLPQLFVIDQLTSAALGLATGLLLGFLAFRLVQGLMLATSLSAVSAITYYHWQVGLHPLPPAPAVPAPAAANTLISALPAFLQEFPQTIITRWDAIPWTLRQSLLVIAGGTAIIAIAISWMAPRHTTWLVSAFAGAGLLIYGGLALLHAYGPQYGHLVPTQPLMRLWVMAGIVAAGLLIQRLYFWPGKRQRQERAKDRPGELLPA